MSTPRCTVLIPSYNGKDHLETCMGSLLAGSLSGDEVEVVVVDNGSTDGSAEWLKARFPRVRVIQESENTGFTGAIEAGVMAGNSEVLVFLNNDTRVEERWLETLVAALEEAPARVATVTGKILNWDALVGIALYIEELRLKITIDLT